MTASPPDTVSAALAAPAAVIERWRAEVAADGSPDTLLWRAAAAALDLTHAHPAGLAKLLSGRDTRLTELFREPASRVRALRAARAVRAKEVELDRQHGLAGCYLLAGTATWTAADAARSADTTQPAAPVFLRRCRVRPLDPGGADYVVEVGGEMAFSPVLHDRLAGDFGLALDAAELTRISLLGNGFDPTGAFAALDDAARGISGWSLQRTLRITTAHVARPATLAEFDRTAPRLSAHPVVGRLLAASGSAAAAAGGTPDAQAQPPDNPDEPFVLDADPAQVAVLEQVRDGVSLVIDAGPGTGKSQTIVNLAADLARVGARTLVVVASRAGRAAVAGRLDHLGLAALVHEPRIDQAPWLSVRTGLTPHAPGQAQAATDGADTADDAWPAWSGAREALHAHVVRMHGRRRPWGVSLDEIQSRLVDLARSKNPPRSKARITGPQLAALDPAAREHWRAELIRVAEQSAWRTGVDDDPWWGADIPDAAAQERVRAALDGVSPAAIAHLDETFDEVFAGVAVPALPTLGHYRDFVAEMRGIAEVLAVFRLGIFDAPLDQLIAGGAGSRSRWRTHRALRSLVRPGASVEQGEALLERARQVRPLWLRVRASDVLPSHVAGLDRAQDAYAAVASAVSVLQASLAGAAGSPPLPDLPLAQLQALIARLDATRDRLEVLPRTRPAIVAARAAGLGDLIDDLARRAVPAERVGSEVDLVWWSSVLQAVTAADPGYATARGDDLRSRAGAFRTADLALQRRLAADVAHRPNPAGPPVWLVSPRAAALVVPEDAAFDVVVVDEAHALTPALAAAVLSRAPQAVIVGDSRMPRPSGFTACAGARVVGEGEPESLLDLASRVLPVHRLPWHYRSHDHRLVAGLQPRYAGSFAAVPAPRGVCGLTLERVVPEDPPEDPPREESATDDSGFDEPGSQRAVSDEPGFQRAGFDESGSGPAELSAAAAAQSGAAQLGPSESMTGESATSGEAAAADPRRLLAETAAVRALEWARERPEESLAIVAVTAQLARLATVALRERAASGRAGARDDEPEPLLVLDAAASAAEVRDAVILVLDADAAAVDPRLLTAAVSRARARMLVVHPFDDAEPTGSRLLDDLLAAARAPEEPGGPPGSVLIDDLAGRLRTRGLAVLTSYGARPSPGGCAPTRPDAADAPDEPSVDGSVDLAVRDPFAKSGAMVAVELDGLRYARAGGIRMRERLRVAQLHRLGWRVIHVASVDLFRDPAREVARIAAAIEGLQAEATHGPEPAAPVRRPRRARSGPVTIGADGPVSTEATEPGQDASAEFGPRTGPAQADPAQPGPAQADPGETGPAQADPGETGPAQGQAARAQAGPAQSADDSAARRAARGETARDRWLRENRPPHWQD